MKNGFVLIAVVLLLATGAFAQNASSNEKPQIADKILVLSEAGGTGKVVKNAPYTAIATTQTTQTLADGSHIVNTTTASLARDSAGRTRREESCPKVGNLQTNDSKMVTISDPVAHTHYMSMGGDDGDGTTIKIGPMETSMNNVMIHKMDGSGAMESMHMMGGMAMGKSGMIDESGGEEGSSANVQHESLGVQVIGGVNAEGVRDTKTIPAGAIGNEKPLVITSETWTSPDLQVVVLSKRNDPRFGETVYSLTDITRGEPDPSLFQIPANAKKDSVK